MTVRNPWFWFGSVALVGVALSFVTLVVAGLLLFVESGREEPVTSELGVESSLDELSASELELGVD